ncbi:hypothetical protein MTF65_05575 [Streptomyces sp. APSN-46.1]|uniref:hypothetical protein n=1 Tax=Streptomyces sp. APSN-46.1 TaxID=2929049 RepID=UPI001FB4628B|nr:hypothetical protein [Streptomyces sp. APSN-46.1]MCJ1676826.1 hypothetical protein [Streptomyces sp. APSN-46.1]
MRTRNTPLAVCLLAVGALALTACGTKSATTADTTSAGVSAPAATPTVDPSAQASAASARHDRLFPEVAERCAAEATAMASPSPSGNGDASMDPEARKYAENHAYKMRRKLNPQATCRGEAHAQRIAQALSDAGKAGKPAPRSASDLSFVLKGLGYEVAGDATYVSGGIPGFALWVPESGPCLTGRLTDPVRIEAHGPYMEGGCVEPRGGH